MRFPLVVGRGAGVVVVVLALAGCAAPTGAPATSTGTPTPTPMPTVSAASKPGSRVPVGCAGLLASDSVAGLAGATAKVDADETTAPTSISSIAQLQFGVLSCVWDGLSSSGPDSPGSLLQVNVAPDSRAAFESRFGAIMADQTSEAHPTATEGIAGDESGFWCGVEPFGLGADMELPICDGEMRVSNYWVSIEVSSVDGFSRAQLVAGVSKAMTDIASALTDAGAPPTQWVSPATTPPNFCTPQSSNAKVRAITGHASYALESDEPSKLDASTVGLVGPYAECAWRNTAGGIIDVELLAGGAWAIPGLVPEPIGDAAIRGPYASTTIPGTTSAFISCSSDVCGAYLAIGASAAEIVTDAGRAKSKTELVGFAKAIAAS